MILLKNYGLAVVNSRHISMDNALTESVLLIVCCSEKTCTVGSFGIMIC